MTGSSRLLKSDDGSHSSRSPAFLWMVITLLAKLYAIRTHRQCDAPRAADVGRLGPREEHAEAISQDASPMS